MKNILIAIDFSPASRKVFRYGTDLAKQAGAKVTLLHVIHDKALERGFQRFAIKDDALMKEMQETALNHLEHKLEEFETDTSSKHLSIQKKLLKGKAELMILKEAEELAADLLVIGSKGHGAMKSVFMGSTTDRLVRLSKTPIAVVPIYEET